MFKKKKVKRELCSGNQKIWFQPLRILYWQFPKPTPYGGNMETMTSFSVTIATSLNILGKCARNFMDDHNLKPNLLSKELETKLGPNQGRLIKGISFRNPKRPYLTKIDRLKKLFNAVWESKHNHGFLFLAQTSSIFALNAFEMNFSHTWIIDLAASDHITSFSNLFFVYTTCSKKQKIKVANGSLIHAQLVYVLLIGA